MATRLTPAAVRATVTPAGRLTWEVKVVVVIAEEWMGTVVRWRRVTGTRARADRVARRLARREVAKQHRLATQTHDVLP